MLHRPHLVRRTLMAVAVLAVSSAGTVGAATATAPAAAAADNGQWGIFPTLADGSAPGTLPRPFFQPLLTPGTSLPDSLTVVNRTDRPLTLNLYGADGLNTTNGTFTLRRSFDPKEDMGAWIRLPVAQVQVDADRQVDVPFTVAVPAAATPGEHIGGIVAENVTPSTQEQGATRVNVLQAVGTRVYGRVDGPRQPALTVTDLRVDLDGSALSTGLGGSADATVTFTVVNTGNVRLTPKVSAVLSPLVGGPTDLGDLPMPEILPRGSVTLSFPVHSLRPLGRASATLHMASEAVDTTTTRSVWSLPWLAVLVVVVLAGAAWAVRRWRRSRKAPVAPDGGAGGDTPVRDLAEVAP
jgi:hypothetical protein